MTRPWPCERITRALIASPALFQRAPWGELFNCTSVWSCRKNSNPKCQILRVGVKIQLIHTYSTHRRVSGTCLININCYYVFFPVQAEGTKWVRWKPLLLGIEPIYPALEKGKQGHLKFLSQINLINFLDCFPWWFTFTKV